MSVVAIVREPSQDAFHIKAHAELQDCRVRPVRALATAARARHAYDHVGIISLLVAHIDVRTKQEHNFKTFLPERCPISALSTVRGQ